jgi:hypothetical protein
MTRGDGADMSQSSKGVGRNKKLKYVGDLCNLEGKISGEIYK